MAKTSSATLSASLRNKTFELLNISSVEGFQRINDRQWGILMIDADGNERYIRVGAIVAEERDDMTARELMESEIADYEAKQARKAEKAAERKAKAEKDKAKRETAKEKDA